MLERRIYITDEDDLPTAVMLLDEAMIDNDLDSGDRIMVSDEDLDIAVELLDEAGIDHDVVV